MHKKKILITGGHVTPAIAVIENLSRNDWDIIYVGRKHALEGDAAISSEFSWITKLNIPFREITTGRLQRSITIHTFLSLFKIPIGFIQAILILFQERPNVILSFGGYIAFPICFVAWFFRIPAIIHEQTMRPGITNKTISFIARKVCISWKSSKKYFPRRKVIYTGNPIRKSVFNITKKFHFSESLPIIYITGGSLGSRVINKVVLQTLPDLVSSYNIIHQCGSAQQSQDYKDLTNRKLSLKKEFQGRYVVKTIIDPEYIGWVYKNADIVISRAGANTITEIILCQKPSVLIPLPWSGSGEQEAHAQFLENTGASFVISQKNLNKKLFLETLESAFENKDKLIKALKKLENSIMKNSASRIIDVVKSQVKIR